MSAAFGRGTTKGPCRRTTPLARWPAFHRLIAERRPPTVFGEQVAGKDGREWLAAVRADLERLGYACGAADMPAAGVGAPHIRQRLWWVADDQSQRRDISFAEDIGTADGKEHPSPDDCTVSGMAAADGWHAGAARLQRSGQHGHRAEDGGIALGVADAECSERDSCNIHSRNSAEGSAGGKHSRSGSRSISKDCRLGHCARSCCLHVVIQI